MNAKKNSAWILIPLILIGSILLHGCDEKDNTITFADASSVWWTAPTIFAKNKDYFKQNKLTVESFDVMTGLASKNAVLSGTADIGLVASTPLAMGAFKKEALVVLCSYVESKHLISLLIPDDPNSPNFSYEKSIVEPVAIVKGTISDFYFNNFLRKYLQDRTADSFKQLNCRPPDVPNVLKKGDARVGVIWEPFASKIIAEQKMFEVRDPDLYTLRLYLITRPDVLEKKPEAVRAFVKSVDDACQYISTNSKDALDEMEAKFGSELIRKTWNNVDFSVKYDYEQMKELIINDAKLAISVKTAPENTLPSIDHLFQWKP